MRDGVHPTLIKLLGYHEARFDVILYSKLGNENSDAGHIKCSRGPQVPHPCARVFQLV